MRHAVCVRGVCDVLAALGARLPTGGFAAAWRTTVRRATGRGRRTARIDIYDVMRWFCHNGRPGRRGVGASCGDASTGHTTYLGCGWARERCCQLSARSYRLGVISNTFSGALWIGR